MSAPIDPRAMVVAAQLASVLHALTGAPVSIAADPQADDGDALVCLGGLEVALVRRDGEAETIATIDEVVAAVNEQRRGAA